MLDLQRPNAQRVLGHSFIERMTGRRFAVLTIGNEAYTRHQLVTQIGTGNFRAARILSDTCRKLELNSVKDLYNFSPYELSAEQGLGITTIFVLMSLFEAKGLDPYRWMFGKGKVAEEAAVSFDTMKKQSRKREVEGAKRERSAKRSAERKRGNERTKRYLKEKNGRAVEAAIEGLQSATH
jgi:hypothetical protein